jgi:hypothetical protein
VVLAGGAHAQTPPAPPIGPLGAPPSASSSAVLELHPTPDFVVEHAYTAPEEAQFEPFQGVRILLLDTQHDTTGAQEAHYSRTVAQAAAYAGVVQVSQLAVPYDPAFQRLEFHHVRVVRDGAVEDRSERTHFDVLRREEFLEQLVMTGALTATLRLDDVRAGDIVDVAYTVYGNPESYGGRHAAAFVLGSPVPIETFALRSRWPSGAAWTLRGSGPEVTETRDGDTFVIEAPPQPLDKIEPVLLTPITEPLVPMIQASSFGDWSDIAAWGREFYRTEENAEVSALAETFIAEHPTKAEQIVAALRFVQQDVRYFALILGEGGYVPAPVSETLRSRSGDCKAKTLLFLSLMDALGVEANAALVSTGLGETLPDWPASPITFDHVLTRVRLDGEDYWLDPTEIFQGGVLDVLSQPDYGYALPLDGSGELVSMERDRSAEPTRIYRDTYDLSEGADEPARFSVEQVLTGIPADVQRGVFASFSRVDLEEAMTGYYSSFLGDAEIADAAQFIDDIDANRFTVTYDFNLNDPYTEDDEDENLVWLNLYGYGIAAPLANVDADARDWPLLLLHQDAMRHEVVVRLPAAASWDFETDPTTIENEAFRYARTVEHQGGRLLITHELEVYTETVAAEQIEALLEDQDEMLEALSYEIYIPKRTVARAPDLTLPPLDLGLELPDPTTE